MKELTANVIMPNGKIATVRAYRARFGYGAVLICSTGNTLPCAFGCEPLTLQEALELAVAFVNRITRKSTFH